LMGIALNLYITFIIIAILTILILLPWIWDIF
jgi:hypothetical protein